MTRSMMVPLRKYSIALPQATLGDAIEDSKAPGCDTKGKFFCMAVAGLAFMMEVVASLRGMLDLQTILKTLVP